MAPVGVQIFFEVLQLVGYVQPKIYVVFCCKEYPFLKLWCLLSWFRICIHIVNPKCHLLKAPKIEFTFSALSSAQLLTGHYNVKIKIRLSIVSQIVCFEMDFQCFHAMRFSEIFQELSSLLCILANIGQDSLSWDLRLRPMKWFDFQLSFDFYQNDFLFENLPLRWFSSTCPQDAAELGFELVTRESCSNSPCIAVWGNKIII